MPALPTPPLITANGDYDIPVLAIAPYLLTLKGSFGGATVTLTSLSASIANTFDSIDGATWTAPVETNVRPPTKTLRLTVTGATGTTAISVCIGLHKSLDGINLEHSIL
jgi:hypothetical protein